MTSGAFMNTLHGCNCPAVGNAALGAASPAQVTMSWAALFLAGSGAVIGYMVAPKDEKDRWSSRSVGLGILGGLALSIALWKATEAVT